MGWPHLSWSTLVNKAQAADEFQKSFSRASTRVSEMSKRSSDDMIVEEVGNTVQLGYSTSREHALMSESVFTSKFCLALAELLLNVEVITDECGRRLSGVLLSSPDSLRKVTVHSYTYLQHTECTLRPEEQIRESQGRDMMHWLHEDVQKTRPRALRAPHLGHSAAPTLADLEEKAKVRKEEKKQEEEEQKLLREQQPTDAQVDEEAEASKAAATRTSLRMQQRALSSYLQPGQRLPNHKRKLQRPKQRPREKQRQRPKPRPVLLLLALDL